MATLALKMRSNTFWNLYDAILLKEVRYGSARRQKTRHILLPFYDVEVGVSILG